MKAVLFFFFVYCCTTSPLWLQQKFDSHKSNSYPAPSNSSSWKVEMIQGFSDTFRTILDDKHLHIASVLDDGPCSAPVFSRLDKDTGKIEWSMRFGCLDAFGNMISGEYGFLASISPQFSDAYLVNDKGVVPGLNQTGFINQMIDLGKGYVLLNLQAGRFNSSLSRVKVLNLESGKELWSNYDTTGDVVLDESGRIFARLNDHKTIAAFDAYTGEILESFAFFHITRVTGSLVVANRGPKNIYALTFDEQKDIFVIVAFAQGGSGSKIWESKPFGLLSSFELYLDHTGQYLIFYDIFAGEVTFINAETGRSVTVISDTDYYGILATNAKNQLFTQGTNSIDIRSIPSGELLQTVSINYNQGRSCIIDNTAIYCCIATECQKFILNQ